MQRGEAVCPDDPENCCCNRDLSIQDYRIVVTDPGRSGQASFPVGAHNDLQTRSGPHLASSLDSPSRRGVGALAFSFFFLNPLLCLGPLNFYIIFSGGFSSFIEI